MAPRATPTGTQDRQQQELARLRAEVARRPGLLPALQATAVANAKWLALDALLVAGGLFTGRNAMVATGAVLFVLPFVLRIWAFRHSGRYDQLLKSFATGDWERVQDMARKLRGLKLKTSQLEFDLDVRLAYIEAKHGRMTPALEALKPWREKLKDSPGLYEARIASVHNGGEDRMGYIRMMEAATQASGGDAARQLDLALAHARYGDAGVAADLLGKIDQSKLPAPGRNFVAWTEGLVQLRGGDAKLASATLGVAVAGFLSMSSTPAVWSALAFCTCDHALALAATGKRDEARREVANVWPIVRPHADRAFVRMLQADGLAPAGEGLGARG